MKPAILREHRLALGYSRSLLADVLRLDPNTLLSWESGVTPIENPEWMTVALEALRAAHTDWPAQL